MKIAARYVGDPPVFDAGNTRRMDLALRLPTEGQTRGAASDEGMAHGNVTESESAAPERDFLSVKAWANGLQLGNWTSEDRPDHI